jgi:N-acylneuraminate cytidylyltransferase
MKIVSIIPARGGSKGIHLKNLTPVNGKPLLYYTIKASINSKLIDKTVVSTDHNKIATYAQKLGAKVITRPKKLASDKARLEPVLMHALNYLQKNENYIPDLFVTLQNTSPLRTVNHVNEAIKLFKKRKLDSLFSACKFHSFLWKIQKNKIIKPINYNPKKRPNRQEMKTQVHENGAIYVQKYQIFKKTGNRLAGKVWFYEMPEELSFEIDSPHDKFIVEQIMKKIERNE